MEETRYSFDQIAKVTGLRMSDLENRRRFSRVNWHAKGYMLNEIKTILDSYPLLNRAEINPRAYKALELYDRLTKEGSA